MGTPVPVEAEVTQKVFFSTFTSVMPPPHVLPPLQKLIAFYVVVPSGADEPRPPTLTHFPPEEEGWQITTAFAYRCGEVRK